MAKKVRYRVVVNQKFCKLCELCISLCPVKNLLIQSNTVQERGKCIGCKRCEDYCPDMAIEVLEEVQKKKKKRKKHEDTPAGK